MLAGVWQVDRLKNGISPGEGQALAHRLAFYSYISLPQSLRCLLKTGSSEKIKPAPNCSAGMIISALLAGFSKHLRNACWGETHIRQKKSRDHAAAFRVKQPGIH